jgi:hypothetical protein
MELSRKSQFGSHLYEDLMLQTLANAMNEMCSRRDAIKVLILVNESIPKRIYVRKAYHARETYIIQKKNNGFSSQS